MTFSLFLQAHPFFHMHITPISIPVSFQGITFESISLNISPHSSSIPLCMLSLLTTESRSSHLQPKFNTIFLVHSHNRITLCVTFHPRFTTSPLPVEAFLFASISTASVYLLCLFIFLSLQKRSETCVQAQNCPCGDQHWQHCQV